MRHNFLLLTLVIVALLSPVKTGQSQPVDRDEEETNHHQVIVIGGGPSGVATASRLMDKGVLDVAILEAEDRLGGRIHSVWFGEHTVDLGAQWVHGVKDNVVYELANPLGLLEENASISSGFENMQFVLGDGKVFEDQDMLFHLLHVAGDIREDRDAKGKFNRSLGEFISKRYLDYVMNPANNITASPSLVITFMNWFERLFAFSDAADTWYDISAKGHNVYWPCEGDQGINWLNNGYYSIIDILTKRYPQPDQELPVRQNTNFQTEVKTILWGPNAVEGPKGNKVVQVETTNGERYTADFLVVTVSLGTLKENAAKMFDPPVPESKRNAIQHLGFGHVNKILMHFTEWWPEQDHTGFSFLVTDDDRRRFKRLYPEYSDKGEWLNGLTGFYSVARQPRAVMYAWLVGEAARNMEKYPEDVVMAGCMRWLEMFTNSSLPQPVNITRSTWYGNPHFRGSYSYRSMESEEYNALPAHLAEPLPGQDGTPAVLFAGEATSDHHFSTVHGAVESGWREADRILNILKVR